MASSATAEASSDNRQARFEQGVALSLNLWPALTLAVQNNWGGPDSADKRDWFAGQVVEQFSSLSTPTTTSLSSAIPPSTTATNVTSQLQPREQEEPDAEYLEELMLQVMIDEFEVNVEDDSAFDVATEIIRLRGQCARGNFEEVDRLLARWLARKGDKVLFKQGEDQDAETDWEDNGNDDDDDDDEDEDEEMEDAPALVAAAPKKEKGPPEVDDDGFTKVTRKR